MTYESCKILSPVGSMDVLEASIKSGADFVYLSGKRYGARGFAENFGNDEIIQAVDYCHENNVKVFVTVNISILEREIVDVLDYIHFLYVNCADGVIIQDLGLAYLVRKLIPGLSIHASTQMTIYDYSFVKWLCEHGFSSANLSREVSLPRVKDITSKLSSYGHDINVEVFGHGALCYSFSGQCLMSSFLGGRSGNRGLCAQPCRMRYSLRDCYNTPISNEAYMLSTKDLCTYNNVDKLVDAGVNCIKIEGRMKSSEYVSATTYCYRKALDGDVSDENYQLLNLAFNRGLTGGYILENNPEAVVGRRQSGNSGYPIGKVVGVRSSDVTIMFTNRKYPVRIVNGDGLKFESDGESCGMYVSKIFSQSKNKIVIGNKNGIDIKKDSMVYITYSKYLKDMTNAIIHENNIHKTTLNLEININNDRRIEFKVGCDLLEKTFYFESDEVLEKAKNKPLTKENFTKQLQKTGNTNYEIRKTVYKNFPEEYFLPISSINKIRRDLIERIHQKIVEKCKPTKNEREKAKENIQKFKEKHFQEKMRKKEEEKWNAYINKTDQAKIIKEYPYINTVYYDSSLNHENIEEYSQSIGDEIIEINRIIPDMEIVWILPQLLLDKDLPHIAETILKLEKECSNIKIQTDNLGVAEKLNIEKYADHMNIYNNYTLKLLKIENFKRAVVSNEISLEDIKLLTNSDCELEYTVFGRLQLMLTKDNFEDKTRDDTENIYYLADKRNNRYEIRKDCYNHSHIYDYRILNQEKQLENLRQTNIKNFTIDLRFFDSNDTKKILEHFHDIIKNNKKEELKLTRKAPFFEGNITKGVYTK